MTSNTIQLETRVATPEVIAELSRESGGLHVSLSLPIRKVPPESDQNPTVLKGLTNEAARELAANGMKEDLIDRLLAPLHSLVEHPRQLLEWAPGVAIFLDAGTQRFFQLSKDVEPDVDVSNRFYIKPLLPSTLENPPLTVLCLNRGSIKAYRGTRSGLKEIQIEGMPVELTDVTGIDDPEKSIQQHTGKTVSAEGRPGSSPAMQTHGQGLPADYESSQFERFFREVAKIVHQYLSGKKDILIAFGVDQNVGIFRDVYKWNDRTLLFRNLDPHKWDLDRLQKESASLVDPGLEEETREELDRLEELVDKGEALSKVEETAIAAATGRVEMAAVASDEAVYGICNPAQMEVRLVDKGEPGCAHDLLDYIAAETIKHGGRVVALPAGRIPGKSAVAAAARF